MNTCADEKVLRVIRVIRWTKPIRVNPTPGMSRSPRSRATGSHSQRGHGIRSRRAPRWNERGGGGNRDQYRRDTGQREGIA
jgi:hypothetical protein